MPLKMPVGPSICSFPNYSSRRFKLRVFVVETWGIRFGVIGPPKCLPIVIDHDLLIGVSLQLKILFFIGLCQILGCAFTS